jgi:hypothetical protein
MAVVGTLTANQGSSAGWWAEAVTTAPITMTATQTITGATFVYPVVAGVTNVTQRVFQPSLPVACLCPTYGTFTSAASVAYSTIQNAINNALPAGVGISSVILGTTALATNSAGVVQYQESGTLTVNFVNYTAVSTMTTGTRLLFIQSQGN